MNDTELVPRLIKTAKQVWRYDPVTTPWGWPHDVYYDRVSNVFIIEDFPKKGHSFEVASMQDGFCDIEVNDEKYRVRVYDK